MRLERAATTVAAVGLLLLSSSSLVCVADSQLSAESVQAADYDAEIAWDSAVSDQRVDETLDKRARGSKSSTSWITSIQRCGLSKYSDTGKQKRIVGGSESRPHEWPWLVSLQLRRYNRLQSDHLCGGTLITRQFILTSAHCFERKWHNALTTDPSMWIVRLGEHNLRAPDRTERQPEIEKIIVHRSRDPSKNLNLDIALVKLKCPANLTNEIGIACLPERSANVPTGSNCVTVGWGTTIAIDRKSSPKMSYIDKVRHVEVPVVEREACRNAYAAVIRRKQLEINISDDTICASNMDGSVRDACQYDSGGPLMCRRGVVDGIVSFGHGCGMHGYPGIYTNVSAHLSWIYETITAEYQRCMRQLRRNSNNCPCS